LAAGEGTNKLLQAIERPPSQSQLVYDQLRAALRVAHFDGGSLLSENDLARQLGVSTTPVHEAMVRLASEGFVELLPRRGVRVVHLSADDVREILEVREGLEAEVIRLALQRLTAEDLTELDGQIAVMDEAIVRNDYPSFNAADVALHDSLARASGNHRFSQMLEELRVWVQRIRAATVEHQLRLPGRPGRAQDEHRALVAALHERDARAEQIIRQHISSLKEEIIAHMSSRGLEYI